MKVKVFLLFSVMVMLLSGCKTDRVNTEKPAELSEYSTTAESHTIPAKGPDTFDADVAEFDLGGQEYTAASGKVMPFQVRGVIGVPKGSGSFPLVLITHGSHENEDDQLRFDTGLNYLVEKLAKNGYIAVSMDMSSAYLWKYGDNDDKEKSVYIADKQMESLRLANDGNSMGYPVDLQGKIDFGKVGLCGHSRGGEAIFDIALKQKEKGQPVEALLSVAPTFSQDIAEKKWTDTVISILVPELDGDVAALDGLSIDESLAGKTDISHYATVLKNANHNYFNANISDNDAVLNHSEAELEAQLSAKEQETFLSHFAVDFFNASLKGKTEDTLYADGAPAPNRMYHYDVMCRITEKEDVVLMDASKKDSLESTDCDVSVLDDSWFYKGDKLLADTVTFGNYDFKQRTLFNIRWEKLGAEVVFSPENTDFRAYNILSLRLIPDPADSLNDNLRGQSLTVTLTDQAGNTSAVTLPDCPNSLTTTPGKLDSTPIEETDYSFWSHPSPIMSTDISLSQFKDVKLEDISTVKISFDQTDRGAVLLERVLLQHSGTTGK